MGQRDPTRFVEDLGALSRALRGLAAQSYAGVGLGSTQANLLLWIGDHPKRSQAELARATQTDPGLAGRALGTLLERGWVRRTRSEIDRRQYLLDLSASGRRLRERVERTRATMAEHVLRMLDDRDLEDFSRVTARVLAAVHAMSTEPERPGSDRGGPS